MTETPRHLQRLLPKAEIAALSDVERKERRIHLVNDRLKRTEQSLTASRQKRMSKMLRQWFRGEVLRDMHHEASPVMTLRAWLRQEFVASIMDAFSGRDRESAIAGVVRQEVGRALQGLTGPGNGVHTRTSAAYSEGMRRYIGKIVEEEVRKQVLEHLSFEVSIKGHAHASAKGHRALQIEGEGVEKS